MKLLRFILFTQLFIFCHINIAIAQIVINDGFETPKNFGVNPLTHSEFMDFVDHWKDVQEIFPNLVLADENSDLSLNYISLIPMLIKAIQEQQVEIEKLKLEIENK